MYPTPSAVTSVNEPRLNGSYGRVLTTGHDRELLHLNTAPLILFMALEVLKSRRRGDYNFSLEYRTRWSVVLLCPCPMQR